MKKLLGVLIFVIGLFCSGAVHAACRPGLGQCPDGTCAPVGSVCCGNGTYCPSGSKCDNSRRQCIPGNAPYSRRPPSHNDNNSGVRDARHCVSVSSVGRGAYSIGNSCTYSVKVRIRTMNFEPRTTSDDSYYLSSGNSALAYSYHRFQPQVLAACGRGSYC